MNNLRLIELQVNALASRIYQKLQQIDIKSLKNMFEKGKKDSLESDKIQCHAYP